MVDAEVALIVGTGPGLSASLARLLAAEGFAVALAARDTQKLAALTDETGARAYACNAAERDQVAALFDAVAADLGEPALVVYNAARRVRGPIAEVDADEVREAVLVTAYGAFLVGQEAARRMLGRGAGTILFTGASAGVKGFAHSAAFAIGKFGLRGLAQSMARELHPRNVHVAHVVIDGGIANPARDRGDRGADGFLDPDEIARTYLQLHRQQRSAWAWEIELRPWSEPF